MENDNRNKQSEHKSAKGAVYRKVYRGAFVSLQPSLADLFFEESSNG